MGDSNGSAGLLILIPFALAAMGILAVAQFASGKKIGEGQKDQWGFLLTWGLLGLTFAFFYFRAQ